EKLPECVKMVRGWSGHPYMMMAELDETFDAAMMIGYHSRAGSNANPLAHTMSPSIASIKINGSYVSEYHVNSYAAALDQVPVVFVSGDEGLCNEVSEFNPGTDTVAVMRGVGAATVSIHPKLAADRIRQGVAFTTWTLARGPCFIR
ncbi:M55 family metallopeptidase, partial [Planctomycetota bacterium]